MVNRTLHSSFFSSDFQTPNPNFFLFSIRIMSYNSTNHSYQDSNHCKFQSTKQITKQVKEQYPLIYFWVAEKTNQTLGKKSMYPQSMYPQMFSVPGKRTNRSLARTKHARSENFFPTLGKKKKKKIQISVGTWWFLVANPCCLVFC